MNELQKLYAAKNELQGELWKMIAELLKELKDVALAKACTEDNNTFVVRATGALLVTDQLLNIPQTIEQNIKDIIIQQEEETERKNRGGF